MINAQTPYGDAVTQWNRLSLNLEQLNVVMVDDLILLSHMKIFPINCSYQLNIIGFPEWGHKCFKEYLGHGLMMDVNHTTIDIRYRAFWFSKEE